MVSELTEEDINKISGLLRESETNMKHFIKEILKEESHLFIKNSDFHNCSDSDHVFTPKDLEIDIKRLVEYNRSQESLENELNNITGHWGDRIRRVYEKCGKKLYDNYAD